MLTLETLVGFDTETTGVKVYEDTTRVVTCSFIRDIPNQDKMFLEWMVDPEVEIPKGASDVHGITTDVAREHGQNYFEGMQSIADTLSHTIQEGTPLVAYNGSYDATLLRVEFERIGVDFDPDLWENMVLLDPLVMDRALEPYRKGKRTLGVVASLNGYDLDNAHEASADVLATLHVVRRLTPKLIDHMEKKFDAEVESFQDLMMIQSSLYRSQMDNLESYFRRSDPDKRINKSWPFQEEGVD